MVLSPPRTTWKSSSWCARYGYAVDTHADNGYAYADLFTPDGVFGKTTGS